MEENKTQTDIDAEVAIAAAVPTTEKQKDDERTKSKILVVCTIIFAILAVAGFVTGIYFFLESNNKTVTNDELQTKIISLQAEIDAKRLAENSENNVVDLAETPDIYVPFMDTDSTHFSKTVSVRAIPADNETNGYYTMSVGISNGVIECGIYRQDEESAAETREKVQDCNLDGRNGKAIDIIDGRTGNGPFYRVLILNSLGEIEYIGATLSEYGVLKKLDLPQKVVRMWAVHEQGFRENGELSPYGGGANILFQFTDDTVGRLTDYMD